MMRSFPAPSARRGSSLVEICVAAAMLAAGLSAVVATLGSVAHGRRAAEQRQIAIEEAENVLERLTAEPWADLSVERIEQLQTTSHIGTRLPAGQLTVKLVTTPGAPDARRLDVEIRWRKSPGGSAAPVRLTTWIYGTGDAHD